LIWTANSFEFVVAGFALSALLVAQWMLSSAIHGTNYDGGDGKMAQATILAAVKFSGLFQVTTISPIEGIGSRNGKVQCDNPRGLPHATTILYRLGKRDSEAGEIFHGRATL
jgi:hypothetical protein